MFLQLRSRLGAPQRGALGVMPLLGAPQEVAEERRQRDECPLETRSASLWALRSCSAQHDAKA